MKKRLFSIFFTVLLAVVLSTMAFATEPAWAAVNTTGAITGTSTYYLTTNIEGNLTIPEHATVNLNLNGYTLTGAQTAAPSSSSMAR